MPKASLTEDSRAATRAFEQWLGQHLSLLEPDLELKHEQMAQSVSAFLRATFYRFMQRWFASAGDLARAPLVLAVGDLHMENFGTWRDAEGRLVWGINDFDEAYALPYTLDLLRLVVSAGAARRDGNLKISLEDAAQAVLTGYQAGLNAGGKPFVLEEQNSWLRELTGKSKDPVRFWAKLTALTPLERPISTVSPVLEQVLRDALPDGATVRFAHRVAGLGSLGRVRVVALTEWQGGWMAREAKALAPSAVVWAASHLKSGLEKTGPLYYADLLARAVRSPDPTVHIVEQTGQILGPSGQSYVVRRLSPSSRRLNLLDLPRGCDEAQLLEAMGFETANIHLGTPDRVSAIQADLKARAKGWLLEGASKLLEGTLEDWRVWKG